jgi:hypothetical protein
MDFLRLSKMSLPSSIPTTMEAKLSSRRIMSAACFDTSGFDGGKRFFFFVADAVGNKLEAGGGQGKKQKQSLIQRQSRNQIRSRIQRQVQGHSWS